ncbi:hypothetical protein MTR67_017876 [Solanum verrucosum]|uniref:Uncharacterized protein n=1 Tax=Solanum verrucosum TaxID=315347 RepID=A0AAF0QPS5_SOLVR|nr:hypothetical protein MTR67_017876 [Solanum verrucosum]
MRILYHPGKENMVADNKKELVRDVHRLALLGVQLVDSTKGGVMVHNDSESSFVLDVKEKQGLDPILMGLKEVVLKNSVEAFFQWGDGMLRLGLSRTRRQHDSIWVIIDCMTKSAHFIHIKVSYSVEDWARLYLWEMVRLHGVTLSVISECDT